VRPEVAVHRREEAAVVPARRGGLVQAREDAGGRPEACEEPERRRAVRRRADVRRVDALLGEEPELRLEDGVAEVLLERLVGVVYQKRPEAVLLERLEPEDVENSDEAAFAGRPAATIAGLDEKGEEAAVQTPREGP